MTKSLESECALLSSLGMEGSDKKESVWCNNCSSLVENQGGSINYYSSFKNCTNPERDRVVARIQKRRQEAKANYLRDKKQKPDSSEPNTWDNNPTRWQV